MWLLGSSRGVDRFARVGEAGTFANTSSAIASLAPSGPYFIGHFYFGWHLLQQMGATLHFATDELVEWSIGRRFAERQCRGMSTACSHDVPRAHGAAVDSWPQPALCGATDVRVRPWQVQPLPAAPKHHRTRDTEAASLEIALRAPGTSRLQCDDGYLFCADSSRMCVEDAQQASARGGAHAAMDAVAARAVFIFCADEWCSRHDACLGAPHQAHVHHLQHTWQAIGAHWLQHDCSGSHLAVPLPLRLGCPSLAPSSSLPADVLRHVGYCATTSDGPSDCERGDSGSWSTETLLKQKARRASFVDHLMACTARCHTCARCRWVSLSVVNMDCSWFHACDTRKLGFLFGGESYLTVGVTAD